jgi:hypothetical protein
MPRKEKQQLGWPLNLQYTANVGWLEKTPQRKKNKPKKNNNNIK